MDSQPSEPFVGILRVRDCVARGDWDQADSIAGQIHGQLAQLSREALAFYLTHLQETLVLAKAARANAVASLVRLNAVAGFHNPDAPATRQNSVVSAIS